MIRSFQKLTKPFIYPTGKVHKNYGKYVGWSCMSNIVISIESVLSTHTMLSVVGQTNSDLTLSINYIGKDIIGQLGGLWYMHRIGQKVDKESSKLEIDVFCLIELDEEIFNDIAKINKK